MNSEHTPQQQIRNGGPLHTAMLIVGDYMTTANLPADHTFSKEEVAVLVGFVLNGAAVSTLQILLTGLPGLVKKSVKSCCKDTVREVIAFVRVVKEQEEARRGT